MKSKQVPLITALAEQFSDYNTKELSSMIICGEVKVAGETIREPRRNIDPQKEIVLAVKKWVSRGGEKLDYAVREWNINPDGKVVLDAGASTGGFTDCMLQHGAAAVHAVDVGYNQLDYRLRKDSRVNVLEKTNIMSVTALTPVPHFAVADLSFRSISGAATHILSLTADNMLVALIKPQFELPETKGFDGVIRDTQLLYDVLRSTAAALGNEHVQVHAVLQSPIKGGKGNIEFLFRLSLGVSDRYSVSNEEIIEEFIKSNQS